MAWTSEETQALISVWGQENVQSQLDGVQRNRVIFEGIARQMCEMNYKRTWQQCRTKIKNLTQRYRKVRQICYIPLPLYNNCVNVNRLKMCTGLVEGVGLLALFLKK